MVDHLTGINITVFCMEDGTCHDKKEMNKYAI